MIEKLKAIKLNYLIFTLALVLTIASSNFEMNLGGLLGYCIWIWGIAYLIAKKNSEDYKFKVYFAAAVITLIISANKVYIDQKSRGDLLEIKGVLQERQEDLKSVLLDKPVNYKDAGITTIDLGAFKKSNSHAEVNEQAVKLVKIANSFQKKQGLIYSKEVDKDLTDFLVAKNLSSLEDLAQAKRKAQDFIKFFDEWVIENEQFKKKYKDAFYLIGQEYPDEIAAFDKSIEKTNRLSKDFYAIEKSIGPMMLEMIEFLDPLYKRGLVRYDSKSDKLLFNNDVDIKKFNILVTNFGKLIQSEEKAIKAFYDSTTETLNKMK